VNPWMQSFTGRKLECRGGPVPGSVNIIDIAHSVARLPRYGGHADDWARATYDVNESRDGQVSLYVTALPTACATYYVGEHLVSGLPYVRRAYRWEYLMHDGHEGLMGVDMPSPLKIAMREMSGRSDRRSAWDDLEEMYARAVRSCFGLGWELSPVVVEADLRMLATEREHILGPSPASWGSVDGVRPYEGWKPRFWTPRECERQFLAAVVLYCPDDSVRDEAHARLIQI
jgi:hypothetical protein